MAHMDLNEAEMFELENIIDRRGISSVLMAISTICGQKSEHISHAWQDKNLAKAWATIEGAVGVIVPKATGL